MKKVNSLIVLFSLSMFSNIFNLGYVHASEVVNTGSLLINSPEPKDDVKTQSTEIVDYVPHLSAIVNNMSINQKGSLTTVKSKTSDYSKDVVGIAQDYFNTIDLNRSDWSGLSANKSLFFVPGGKEIIQEISIVVPPLYEMLLFSKKNGEYKSGKLLDKSIKKQCERYAKHFEGRTPEDLQNYIRMVSITKNRVVAKLKSDMVTVTFKCSLAEIVK